MAAFAAQGEQIGLQDLVERSVTILARFRAFDFTTDLVVAASPPLTSEWKAPVAD